MEYFFRTYQCGQIGQILKASDNNYFAQIAHIFRHFFKGVQIFEFLVKTFLGNFYRHLATFYWSHWHLPTNVRSKVRRHFWLAKLNYFIKITMIDLRP